MDSSNALVLDHYFPNDLRITDINEGEKNIIHLKSQTRSCIFPKYHKELNHEHGTYIRKVQYLPILEKNVQIKFNAYEYQSDNQACPVYTVAVSIPF